MRNQEIDYGKLHLCVLYSRKLSDGAKTLWVTLKYRGNSLGVVWWSIPKLAQYHNVSAQTVRNRMREMERVGLIKVNNRPGTTNEVIIQPFSEALVNSLDPTVTSWEESMDAMVDPSKILEGYEEPEEIHPSKILEGSPQENLKGGSRILEGSSENSVVTSNDSPGLRRRRGIKRKPERKREKETGASPKILEGRASFKDVEKDDLVTRASEKTVQAKERGHARRNRRAVVPRIVEPVPDPVLCASWTQAQWRKAFVDQTNKKGLSVAGIAKTRALEAQITSIRQNLANHGFDGPKIFDFLLVWLPDNWKMIHRNVLKGRTEDPWLISLGYLEARLVEVVAVYTTERESAVVLKDSRIEKVKIKRRRNHGSGDGAG